MGTPLPPNLKDDRCDNCFSLGKRFENQLTPRVLILQFVGFTPDLEWNPDDEMNLLAPHYLQQQADPCVYLIIEGGILFYFRWFLHSTLCSIEEHLGLIKYFRGDVSDPCQLLVQNELLGGINTATVGGVITVGWNPGDL